MNKTTDNQPSSTNDAYYWQQQALDARNAFNACHGDWSKASKRAEQAEVQRDTAVAALRECYDLVSNSDVKHYISTKLGEQARVHSAINKARAAIAAVEKGQ